jgi:hypothetical protein
MSWHGLLNLVIALAALSGLASAQHNPKGPYVWFALGVFTLGVIIDIVIRWS